MDNHVFSNGTRVTFIMSLTSRSPVISLDIIQGVINSHDVAKMKNLLRANELPIEHEARAQLWLLLSCGSAETLGDDETFCMYAGKFASGE